MTVRQIPSVLELQSPPEIRERAGHLTIEDVVCGRCRIATGGVVFRRRVFLDPVVPPETFRGISLGDLFYKIDSAIYGGIGYVPEAMVTYRMVSGSATHTGNPAKAMKFEWDALKIRDFYCKYCNLSSDVAKSIHADAFRRMSRISLNMYSPHDVDEIRRQAKEYGIEFTILQKIMFTCGENRMLSWLVCNVIAALKAIRDLMRRRKSMAVWVFFLQTMID